MQYEWVGRSEVATLPAALPQRALIRLRRRPADRLPSCCFFPLPLPLPLLALQLSHSESSFACAADLLGAFKAKEYNVTPYYSGPLSFGKMLNIQVGGRALSSGHLSRHFPTGT